MQPQSSASEPHRPAAQPARAGIHRRKVVLGTASAAVLSAAGGLSMLASAQGGHRFGIVGQPAPEISLDYWIDKDGQPGHFSVLENRGKWVFLKCFQNWCPGCHSSGFPTLKKFSDAFWEHPDVAIAGIQTVFEGHLFNRQSAVRKLQVRYDLPIVMGHDPGESEKRPQTMSKYRTGGTPWLILVAPDGNVVFNDYHVDTVKLIDYVRSHVA